MADRTEQQIIDDIHANEQITRQDIYEMLMKMSDDDKKDKDKKKDHIDKFLKKIDKSLTKKKNVDGRFTDEKILDDLHSYPV